MQNNHLWQAALVIGLCALASPVTAQERGHTPQARERADSTALDHAETVTDQALVERIRQGLQENAPLSGVAPQIRLSVANGEVTLQGEVKTAGERDGVEAQVRQIQGVQVVQNRLRLAGADRESSAQAPSAHD
jgi:osmotically-inducible protein OsmY